MRAASQHRHESPKTLEAAAGATPRETTLLELVASVSRRVGDDEQTVQIVTDWMARGWIRRRRSLHGQCAG